MSTENISALERLLSLSRFGVQLGLSRMQELLVDLGSPERSFLAIHIAGTNGKGSTSAMLAAILQAAGLRVGLYTSPHLCRFSERIQVNGKEIPSKKLDHLLSMILERRTDLTFFEVATAAAFLYFFEERIEVAVIETGLGGRLDATNVIDPLLCIITAIGLDHAEILGHTLNQITEEKAGIIKPSRPIICAQGAPEVIEVITRHGQEKKCSLYCAGRDFSSQGRAIDDRTSQPRFDYLGMHTTLHELELNLRGIFQIENACLALAAWELLREAGWPLTPDHARQGLKQARWPGRLEMIGNFILDGAHNPQGAGALADCLAGKEYDLILGLLGPKDVHSFIEPLLPGAKHVIFTRPKNDRALDPRTLAQEFQANFTQSLKEALALVTTSPRPCVITGSLYLIGEARALLTKEPQDSCITADPMPAAK